MEERKNGTQAHAEGKSLFRGVITILAVTAWYAHTYPSATDVRS